MKAIKFNAEISGILRKTLARRPATRLDTLPYSAAALLAAELRRIFRRAVVVVNDSPRTMDEFQCHLEALDDSIELLRLPPGDNNPVAPPAVIAEGERRQILYKVQNTPVPLVVTCIQALMWNVPPPQILREESLCIRPGTKIDPAVLAEQLAADGYDFEYEISEPGQAARRGGLLDLWPPGADQPFRVEFFGNEVDTLRQFDPLTQRSQNKAGELIVLRASRESGNSKLVTPIRYLPADSIFLWVEPGSAGTTGGVAGIEAHAEVLVESAPQAVAAGRLTALAAVREEVTALAGARELIIGGEETAAIAVPDLGFRRLQPVFSGGNHPLAPDVFEKYRREWLEALARAARHGRRVCVFFGTDGALQRFRELYPNLPFELRRGALTDGFDNDLLNLTAVSESNLSGRRKWAVSPVIGRRVTRGGAKSEAGEAIITGSLKIEPGDLVVHVGHGIGRYLGLFEIEFNRERQEVLAVEYAEQARLYVPTTQAHLLSRYVGSGRHQTVNLHRLGGARWKNDKKSAERAVYDLAAGLLETQALRNARPGFAFPADAPWQYEFEAAFPHQETPDQEAAIRNVKSDLQAARPMDRLVCGDAGYGKTEVAMRAAFKCVLAGRQVALLAPTTVLAQQHFECFKDRMNDYPVRIEMLCRFQTPAEQFRIARDLRAGTVDIVIGTHRLVQNDIALKDLGLVIIDEEQRFGVEHKERLKRMKQMVDVLTLTATPIPRTLYMSLTGVREISVIQTPPLERRPVETIVARDDDNLVREAILRELNRGGQVYFLYNRIITIHQTGERLRRLVPEARIGIAHGRMAAGELAEKVRQFARGNLDILLCTTIIESGIDIPNANTIIIDRADRFGMAELYQLRGRVGRSSRSAYAYLLLPAHGHLLDDARRRIGAIAEYNGAGAGFRLALRDLEIRGAGNLLGAAQSGHIAAVGFELYCQFLRRSVAILSGKTGTELPPVVNVEIKLDFISFSAMSARNNNGAFLPSDYIDDERVRLEFFRRMAAATNPEELAGLRDELSDRFGRRPPPLERMLNIAELRIHAAAAGIIGIETRDDRIMLRRPEGYIQHHHQFPRFRKESSDEKLKELLAFCLNLH